VEETWVNRENKQSTTATMALYHTYLYMPLPAIKSMLIEYCHPCINTNGQYIRD